MPKVFISYSHKDEAWKERLQTQLAVLEMEGLLSVWEDRQIDAGADAIVPSLQRGMPVLTAPAVRNTRRRRSVSGCVPTGTVGTMKGES